MENKTPQPTDTNVAQLELKHIAKYLPNILVFLNTESGRIHRASGAYVSARAKNLVIMHDNGFNNLSIWPLKPVLRSPDLTKPITHKGETFVPLLELAKIAFPSPENNWQLTADNLYVKNWYGVIFGCDKDFYTVSSMAIPNQELLFEKLAEWMIDTKNLIRDGLGIDVETLSENPYK